MRGSMDGRWRGERAPTPGQEQNRTQYTRLWILFVTGCVHMWGVRVELVVGEGVGRLS